MLKLIVLDRDGVINHDSPDYIRTPEQWIPVAGSLSAIAALSKAGYLIAVATNQSGIARGYYSVATLERMHLKMLKEVRAMGGKIDAIFVCMHLPEQSCDCRKPKPGLLKQASQYFNIPPQEMIFIGDSSTDMEAAGQFGCLGYRVRQHSDEQTCFENLAEIATTLLKNNGVL